MRAVAVRMARAMGGGVEYWLELPVLELSKYMVELIRQLEAEQEAIEEAKTRR